MRRTISLFPSPFPCIRCLSPGTGEFFSCQQGLLSLPNMTVSARANNSSAFSKDCSCNVFREIPEHLNGVCLDWYIIDRKDIFHGSSCFARLFCWQKVFLRPDSFGILLGWFMVNLLKIRHICSWHAACFRGGIWTQCNVSAIVLAKNE